MKTERISVRPVPGTLIAESKDDARAIRQSKLLPALERGNRVQIDFGQVGFATQSFIHALLSEAIRTYGDSSFDLISFVNCTSAVREVILTVFEYTLAAADVAAEGGS